MAEENDAEKTEDPTQRKLEQAHEKGDVVKSQEVAAWFTAGAVLLIVALISGPTAKGLVLPLSGLFEHAGTMDFDGASLTRVFLSIGVYVGVILIVPLAIMAVAGVIGHAVQHRLVFSAETLKPKFSKISPLAGFKRLFSQEALLNFVKGILKLVIVGAVMFMVVWPERERLEAMVSTDLAALLAVLRALALKLMMGVVAALAVVAALDYLLVRQRWMKRQRMTLQEVKEEHKQSEGSPEIKARVRRIRMERAMRRMMQAVPTATVVITNPTHYAVALKYEPGMAAPTCVAKGVDAVALRIREVAATAGVAIVENVPLARALHAAVEIDEVIPEDQYKAVAEVIGYVMSLKRKGQGRPAAR